MAINEIVPPNSNISRLGRLALASREKKSDTKHIIVAIHKSISRSESFLDFFILWFFLSFPLTGHRVC